MQCVILNWILDQESNSVVMDIIETTIENRMWPVN